MELGSKGWDMEGTFSPLVTPKRKPSALWVPKVGKTTGFYRDMPSGLILNAWGIGLTGIRHPTNPDLSATKPLPDLWRVEKHEFIPLWFVKDEKGHNRLKLNEYPDGKIALQILSPIKRMMTGDHEGAEWVEITHHDEVIFTSSTVPTSSALNIKNSEFDLSEVEMEKSRQGIMAHYAPIYSEAENYIANYYPRVRDDPNAYW